MLFFYKQYDNCLIATIMSLFSYGAYVIGVVCAGATISEGENVGVGLLALVICAAIGFGLGKWADKIALKKQRKVAAKKAAKEAKAQTVQKTVVQTEPIKETIPATKVEPQPVVVSEPVKVAVVETPKVEEVKVEVPAPEKVVEAVVNNWKCPECGNMNDGKFCKECGAKKPVQKDKFCTNCGAKLKEGQKFCGECGTKVE